MRIFLTIVVWIILTPFFTAQSRSVCMGDWYNGYLEQAVHIDRYGNKIEILGLHSANSSTVFRRRTSRTYYDAMGNYIKLSQNKITYYGRRGKVRLTFIASNIIRAEKNNRRREYPLDHHHSYFAPLHQDIEAVDISSHQSNNKYQTAHAIPSTIDNSKIEGTWVLNDKDIKVFILDTRDGIKARISTESQWYIYKNGIKPNTFTATTGQTFVHSNGKLTWIGQDGIKHFELTKWSDDIEF